MLRPAWPAWEEEFAKAVGQREKEKGRDFTAREEQVLMEFYGRVDGASPPASNVQRAWYGGAARARDLTQTHFWLICNTHSFLRVLLARLLGVLTGAHETRVVEHVTTEADIYSS